MGSLPAEPFRAVDFAGGLTENFIGGGPTRYMAADNFWVTVDRKLEERYGSDLLDSVNYISPSAGSPIKSLLTFDNEKWLLHTSTQYLYVQNPNWAQIQGPTGNPAMAGATAQNQMSWGEWNHHLLMTNDSLVSKPVTIFQGAGYPINGTAPTNITNLMCVTAGLPALTGTQNISNSVLLSKCITLANEIRSKMISHMLDFGAVVNTNLHASEDSVDINILNASTPASDLPSLLNLITALIAAYEPHVTDAINGLSSIYHWSSLGALAALNFHLTNTQTPTTLTGAATILDDLKSKFLMHQLAVYTHDGLNNYNVIGRYLVSSPHIGTVTTGPVFTPSYTQSFALANQFKDEINAHNRDASYHMLADTVDAVTVPYATDLDSLYILIVHCRTQYTAHYNDSTQVHNLVTGTTNSDTSLTSIKLTSTGGTFNPAGGETIYDASGTNWPNQPTTIVSIGPVVVSSAALTTGTAQPLDITFAKYHIAQNQNQLQEIFPGGAIGYASTYPPTSSALSSWISLLTQGVNLFNAHDNDATVHKTSSLHQITSATPTIASYAYAMHLVYQYQIYTGVIFQTLAPVSFFGPFQTEQISPAYSTVNPTGGAAILVPAVSLGISNIPTLVNGAGDNYDTSNVQVEIFRTINAGQTYFNTGIIPNGTTTFTDTTPDTTNALLPGVTALQNNTPIYTSGGVINYDPPPLAKFCHILNNTAYYAHIIDTGQTFSNRVRQSIQGAIVSSPGASFDDLDDVITGISSTRNNLVVFCQNSVYRLFGSFDTKGNGAITHERISDVIGCVSESSIVKTDVGIFFAGTDGFYYTDGYQLIKLSSELNLTYASLVSNASQKLAIYGCYDRYNRRVWWSTQPDPSDWAPSQSYIFHVNFGVTAQGVFTTASNLENYRPSSMIFYKGQQIRGDSRGYFFLHSNLKKTDPQVNINTTATGWNTVVIPYNYSSCAVDFGTTFNRKWTTRISVQGKNVGNVGAQITSISDNGRVPPGALAPIWFRPNMMWGDPTIIWGAPNSSQPVVWGGLPEMDAWRRFPATQLRSDFKQIVITPAKIGVYRYTSWPVGAGAMIVPGGAGTATVQLMTPPGFSNLTWPLDVVGYVFAQQGDNYVAEYPILSLGTTTVPNDTFTVSDPNNVLTSNPVAWIIRGQLKQQRVSITGYTIHFSLLGKMQSAYRGPTDAGENTLPISFQGSRILMEDGSGILDEDGGSILGESP